jgi:hypothetical protein
MDSFRSLNTLIFFLLVKSASIPRFADTMCVDLFAAECAPPKQCCHRLDAGHYHFCALSPKCHPDPRSTMIVKREGLETSVNVASARVAQTQSSEQPHPTCRFAGCVCSNPPTVKRNGAVSRFCETHAALAANAQRRQQRRHRLLRCLVNALQQDDLNSTSESESNRHARPRQRPRLVSLGNGQTLILGVVLSDFGVATDLRL